MKKLLTASVFGSVVEWYDFILIGAFAPILSVVFFSGDGDIISIIKLFFLFSVGFFARPLGAIYFGYFGDRHKRLDSLTKSLLIVSLSTLAIGVIPSYEAIGLAAPLLLLVVRLTQGFGASGEHAGAITLMYESEGSKSNFFTSLSLVGVMVGLFFGFAVNALFSAIFTEEELIAGAWRIPFVLGGIVGLIGVAFRKKIEKEEKTIFTKDRKPLHDLAFGFRKELIIAIGIYWFSVVIFYASYFFLPSIVISDFGLHSDVVSGIRFINMVIFLMFLIIFCYLTDYLDLRMMMLISLLAALIIGLPAFYFGMSPDPLNFLIGQMLLTIINALYLAPIAVVFAKMFDQGVRYSGVGISINFASAIFGGTTPMIMLSLSEYWQDPKMSLIYVAIAIAVSAICVAKASLENDEKYLVSAKNL